MTTECKTWPNKRAAMAALNAVKSTWTAPTISYVRCSLAVRNRLLNKLVTLEIAGEASELTNGKWAIVADHPGFKGDFITTDDIVKPTFPDPQAAPGKPPETPSKPKKK